MFRFKHPLVSNIRPEQKPEHSRSISFKTALAIGAVPLLLLFGAAFQSSNSVPGQLQAIQSQLSALMSQNRGLESQISGLESQNSALQLQVASLANKGPRKFYVTKTVHQGDDALSACAYHMASMWEIHDPSNLRYDTVLGATLADSGLGAPNHFGWIRTGTAVTPGTVFGFANCQAWTTASSMVRGTLVAPVGNWESGVQTVSPWHYAETPIFCSASNRVWCVRTFQNALL